MRSRTNIIKEVLFYAFIAVVCLVFLFPFYWLIITSFKIELDIFHYPPVYFPMRLTDWNYRTGLIDLWGLKGITDSFIISSLNTLFVMALSLPAAYALALLPIRGRNSLLNYILSQRMLPPIAAAIPIFVLWNSIGWLDTYQALILTYSVFNLPFAIWLLTSYIQELPREVYESALVDGASRINILRHIIVPLIKPSIAIAALFTFIFSWNEFLFALLLTRSHVRPFTVIIPSLIGGHVILWGAIAAVTLVGLIPTVILVLMLQRHLIRGLTFGAIKG
ncbi:MAG: carbohydrate ABC transporter permease [Candidatus Bathyarchaeia archaeon]